MPPHIRRDRQACEELIKDPGGRPASAKTVLFPASANDTES
jgi:hypothetical protein